MYDFGDVDVLTNAFVQGFGFALFLLGFVS